MDLYRLHGTSSKEFEPLQLEHVFANCISLIEWPVRLKNLPELLPSNLHRLDVTISTVPKRDTRLMTILAPAESTWKERLRTLVDEGIVEDLLCTEDN
jgi:tRNA A37 threonylcarbamoyladenosine biosynthesis protein TsaE